MLAISLLAKLPLSNQTFIIGTLMFDFSVDMYETVQRRHRILLRQYTLWVCCTPALFHFHVSHSPHELRLCLIQLAPSGHELNCFQSHTPSPIPLLHPQGRYWSVWQTYSRGEMMFLLSPPPPHRWFDQPVQV